MAYTISMSNLNITVSEGGKVIAAGTHHSAYVSDNLPDAICVTVVPKSFDIPVSEITQIGTLAAPSSVAAALSEYADRITG